MKVKNLLITKHGSHLYNTSHAMSDIDMYVIYKFAWNGYKLNKLISQSIDDESDTTKVHLSKFETQVIKGVPQALEALYAPRDKWLDYDPVWPAMGHGIKTLVPQHIEAILETYRRTALNFINGGDEKRARHAFRLLVNARQLKLGDMNPSLTPQEVASITTLAKLPSSFRLEKFKEQLFDI